MVLHSRYCPTILLLRHFEVFRNLAAQEGSSHEQVGVNSEVASVIKQCTEPISEDADDCNDESSIGDSVSFKFFINSFNPLPLNLMVQDIIYINCHCFY